MNKTGVDGENFACDYLLRQGYEIIERNYHSRYGEIDIIARDKNRDFVFVEVKSRTKKSDIKPCEYVDERKMKKILITALAYLGDKADSSGMHFDVIDIIYQNGIPMIKHYKDSFGGNVL